MSEQELWLDRARAHRAGTDLALSGRAIAAQRNGLGEEIAAASADRPWGKDAIGAAFEQKYRAYETKILEAWANLGSYVEGLGGSVVHAVNASSETDAASAARFGKISG